MVSVPVTVNGSQLVVQVAGSLDDVHNVVSSASILFLVMGLALLVAVGTAGALFTGRVFQAIDNVVRRARHIGDVSLNEKLPHPGTNDEIGRLVDTLNDMLGRLQQRFDVQRRFTADASHELRSPLSRLRTDSGHVAATEESAEYVETLHSCMEDVERSTTLVEELLALARLDAGQERGAAEIISLGPVAEDAIERVRTYARERQVKIVLEACSDVAARVPRASASLVLANLLDNAVKFSPPGARISVGLATEGAEAVMRVSDTGPGIAPDELPHLFERFYRGSVARAASVPGVGLGLALSQAIVQAHGGRLDAANRPEGGAIFTIRLPMAA